MLYETSVGNIEKSVSSRSVKLLRDLEIAKEKRKQAKNLARNFELIDGILSDNDCKSIIKQTMKQKQKLN